MPLANNQHFHRFIAHTVRDYSMPQKKNISPSESEESEIDLQNRLQTRFTVTFSNMKDTSEYNYFIFAQNGTQFFHAFVKWYSVFPGMQG